jgi:hypothetical protein
MVIEDERGGLYDMDDNVVVESSVATQPSPQSTNMFCSHSSA